MPLIDEYIGKLQKESSTLKEELEEFEIQRKKYLFPSILITTIISSIFWYIMIVFIARIHENFYVMMVVLIIAAIVALTNSVKEFLSRRFIPNYSHFF